MSVQSEINRISANVSDAFTAVEEKGGTVPSGATSDNLASSIRSIKGAQKFSPAAGNLLDNSDFTNPVNQRAASGTIASWKYLIDRWQASSAVTISISNGLVLTGDILQNIAVNCDGKTITFAVKINGEVSCCTGSIYSVSQWTQFAAKATNAGGIYICKYASDQLYVAISNSTQATVEWAALYEGEYTAETLPEYVPKGYGTELAECRRYYYKFDTGTNGFYLPSMSGATQIPGFLFPSEMWAAPNLTITSLKQWTIHGFTDMLGSISSKRCTKGGMQYIELTSAPSLSGLVSMVGEFNADL